MTYLVTGATGAVGRHVVTSLLERGVRVRALTRSASRARFADEVEVVEGDLTRLDTIVPALEGVAGVHLIDTADSDYTPLRNGSELVKLLEGRKVTLLSSWGEGTLEPALRASTLDWTYIQPTEFMSNALAWAQSVRLSNRIEEPFAATKTVMVHEADIGAVIAHVLTSDGHTGKTYGLTGGERLDIPTKVRILGEAIGREIEFVELSIEQMRAKYAAEGVPEEMIDFQIRVFGDVDPDAYQPSSTVADLLGRTPLTFAQWAAEHADAFRPEYSSAR
ncbi:SDR family oxidoreductase [Nonomuraea sp. NPDC050663]|uniref:SDR family oxidoreductase n=1 Tax=Nonomuraea sp. NPDC050663 TaxID=3364370 RepID=UPI00378ED3FB